MRAPDDSRRDGREPASDERMRAALSLARAGTFDIDLSGANPPAVTGATNALFGLADDGEYPTETYLGRVHPDDRERVERVIDHSKAAAVGHEVEYRVRHPDGTVLWLASRAVPILDAEGRATRLVGTLIDATARRRVEAELQRHEAEFRTLADAIPTLAWMAHADGWIFWYNRRWYEYTGTTPEQMEGWGWERVHDPAALPAAKERWQASIATGEAFEMTFPLRGADGAFRPFLTRIVPLRDESGAVTRWFGTNTDVSPLHESQARLAASEARLRLALEASDTGLWNWYPATDAIVWSPEMHRVLGVASDRPARTSRDFFDLVHPEDRERVLREVAAAIAERRLYESEFRVIRPDGEVIWVADRGRATYDEQGTAVSLSGTITDVTRRRRAEDTLRRSEERLRLALGAARAGAWDWDLRTGAIRWSPENFALYGVVPKTGGVVYEDWSAALDPRDLAQVEQLIRGLLEGSRAEYRAEFRVLLPDGATRWLVGIGQVQRDDDGLPLRMYGLNLDITAQKHLEEALQRADRQKDRFLATLSHELRNPLAPIRTAAKILASPKLEDGQLVWARQVIQRQVEHLALLLDDLLDLARVTQGKVVLQRRRASIDGIVESAIEAARPLLDAKHHRLAVSIAAGAPAPYVDPLRVSQVLSNLLTNAAKYTDDGGRVQLSVSADERAVTFEVADNGVGIPSEALPGIFEMFSQVDGSRMRSDGGLGIGLALVRGLVELHGGEVEASSAGIGRGSVFRVRLPLEGAPSDATPASGEPVAAPVRRRVLVVDDNRDAADALAMLLSLSGHEVRVAHGGREALALAPAFRPQVALVDLGMPDVDGLAVARELRCNEWGRDVCLVALTGWGQDEDKARSREAGFDHHLTKPVDPDDVETLLRGGECDRASLPRADAGNTGAR